MEMTVTAKTGYVEIRTERRTDNRWASQLRYVPDHGPTSGWTSACSPEGFVSEGMALSAAILLGKKSVEELSGAKPRKA